MAQSGYTPILIYASGTATNVPLAADLTSSASGAELALNYADGKLYFKNSSGVVTLLASSSATGGTFTNLTVTGVADFADGTAALPSITNTGDTNTGIFFPAADTIAFTKGGAEIARFDSAGNLGIGTSAPVAKLDLLGADSSTSGTIYGIYDQLNTTSASGSGAKIGIQTFANAQTGYAGTGALIGGILTAQQGNASVNTGNLIGSRGQVITSGAGTINSAVALQTAFTLNSASTIPIVAGLQINAITAPTSGTTTAYGVQVGAITNSAATYGFWSNIVSGATQYNFYAAGTADNYFAGNLGIGTNTPSTKLEIAGDNNTAWTNTTTSISGTTMTVVGTVTGTSIAVGDLIFGSGIQPYTRVTALGTGTGGAGTYTVSVSQTFASATVFGTAAYGNTIIRITDTDTSVAGGQPNGALQFYTSDGSSPTAGVGAYVAGLAEQSTPDTALVFGTRDNGGGGIDANERMRIDSSGNVGIGTTSPSTQLYIQSASTNGLVINEILRNPNSGTGIAAIGFNVASTAEGDYTQAGIGLLRGVANGSGSLCFYNKGSGTASNFTTADEKMRIDSGGNLLVGTTTSPAGSKELVLGGDYIEGVVAIGTVTTSSTISLANGTVQTATLTASTACTFTMPSNVAGKSFVMLLKQAAATGNGTATFTGVKWSSAGAPTITATAGKMDILTFIADGTNWYGSAAQGYTP